MLNKKEQSDWDKLTYMIGVNNRKITDLLSEISTLQSTNKKIDLERIEIRRRKINETN